MKSLKQYDIQQLAGRLTVAGILTGLVAVILLSLIATCAALIQAISYQEIHSYLSAGAGLLVAAGALYVLVWYGSEA